MSRAKKEVVETPVVETVSEKGETPVRKERVVTHLDRDLNDPRVRRAEYEAKEPLKGLDD